MGSSTTCSVLQRGASADEEGATRGRICRGHGWAELVRWMAGEGWTLRHYHHHRHRCRLHHQLGPLILAPLIHTPLAAPPPAPGHRTPSPQPRH
ncbi:hypothetical protein E2C01_027257 [Portunus trituberculatus]|uniref:Uncharacterized protein n=1 Tax=Portunus trituberculatus TaxID=210409 RepID=A0A5B7EHQ7_PORTR|nr:hypothetical protein [Portunus trituberculatus]